MQPQWQELLGPRADVDSVGQGIELVLAMDDAELVVEALALLSEGLSQHHEWGHYDLLGRAADFSSELRERADAVTQAHWWGAPGQDIISLAPFPNLRSLVVRAPIPNPARLAELQLHMLEFKMFAVGAQLLSAARLHPSLQELRLIDVVVDSLDPLRGARLHRLELACYDKHIDPGPLGDVHVDGELDVCTRFDAAVLGKTTAAAVTLARMRWNSAIDLSSVIDLRLKDVRGHLEFLAESAPNLRVLCVDSCPDVERLRLADHSKLREIEVVGMPDCIVDVDHDVFVHRVR